MKFQLSFESRDFAFSWPWLWSMFLGW